MKGKFSVINPNFKNSDKSVNANVQSLETDKLTTSGYKTNKTGFGLGTKFEYLRDLKFGVSTTSFFEKIEEHLGTTLIYRLLQQCLEQQDLKILQGCPHYICTNM